VLQPVKWWQRKEIRGFLFHCIIQLNNTNYDNSNRRDTCRLLFDQLRILPLPSQYIYSLLLFVATNKKLFLLNSQIRDINTRHNNNLHLPSAGLTLVQKGVAYSGCKIYNHLPPQIKNISNNVTLFKSKLKKFLLWYAFYSVDEYYQKIWCVVDRAS